MSLLKKISLLFLIGLSLTIAIAYRVEKSTDQKAETETVQRYFQAGKQVFSWLIASSHEAVKDRVQSFGLESIETREAEGAAVIFSQPHTFGALEVLKGKRGEYLLRIRYFEDLWLFRDSRHGEVLYEQRLLNILLLSYVLVLVVIFLVMLKILLPLRQISDKMRAFARGDYQSRLAVKSRDEIGEVAETYNMMAQKLQDHIIARESMLRDVGHELRTPISKGYFAVEALEESPAKEIIKRAFSELKHLSTELLELEKLQVLDTVEPQIFKAETLILEALSKLMFEDESKLKLSIEENFLIKGDLNYLAIALKNLIDNAIKYTTDYPIFVTAKMQTLAIRNKGEALEYDISRYLDPFVREKSSRIKRGYGLGLGIVTKILDKHDLKLNYAYEEGFHLFTICFGTEEPGIYD